MSLKQCSGCATMVDETKAFCSNCGNPMDDEQKRTGSSEFDALAKTQNLSATRHLEILEQFNLSMIFAPSKKTPKVSQKVEPDAQPPKPTFVEPNLSSTNGLRNQVDNAAKKPEPVYELSTWNLDVQRNKTSLRKKIYLAISLGVLLILLLLLGVIAVYFIFQPR